MTTRAVHPPIAGPHVGLTMREAAVRLAANGPNQLPEARHPSLARRVLGTLREPLSLVLLGALVLTVIIGDLTDAVVIGIVIVVNSSIGVRQDVKAERAVSALADLAPPRALVVRSGLPREVLATEVVPGDLVVLGQGDLVPADAVLVDGSGIQLDESMFTGESLPVDRSPGQDPGPDVADLPAVDGQLATHASKGEPRLLSGTVVLHGHGHARVTATGLRSELGRLAAQVAPRPQETPLQRRMARLSAQLAVVAVAFSMVVLAVGLLRGQPLELMALTAVALVVAAVPEALPLVVTISLALAARRMAARHALVRRLPAVEALGSVTLLATDKTGTLTQGSMSVTDTWIAPSACESDLLRALVLCSNASIDTSSGRVHGDPTESALLLAAKDAGTDIAGLRAAHPRLAETPFDSARKVMTTVHDDGTGERWAVHKGAPEAVLGLLGAAASDQLLVETHRRSEEWGRQGARVIAVAEESPGSGTGSTDGRVARLLGLVALVDPVRDSSARTISRCQEAGLRVVLITGDHPATAAAIAAEVGIGHGEPALNLAGHTDLPDRGAPLAAGVIARATPAHKRALVDAYQRSGQVVAMTGDGVNDAPALRAADIGVAMGRRGTEVARQAADLVLADDNLETLVAAVAEGRRIYMNLRRFLVYGLSGGASEVLLMLAGPVLGVPLPLLPAQILWLNLLTHSFAGAGLAAEPGGERALVRGPRPPRESPLAGGLWWRTIVLAVYLAVASLVVMRAAGDGATQSAVLLALGGGQLAVAWGLRSARLPRRRLGERLDPLLAGLLAAGSMLVAAITIEPLRDLIGTQPVGSAVWGMAIAVAGGAWLLARVLRVEAM